MYKELAPTTLLLKTPPYKGSDFFPHIVEHCVKQIYPLTCEHFFTFLEPVHATLKHTQWTEFFLPHDVSLPKLLKQIQLPLNKEIITEEKKAMKDELSEGKSRFEENADLLAGFLKEPRKSSHMPVHTFQEVFDYHSKWYKQPQWVLIGVYDDRLKTNIQSKYASPLTLSFPGLNYFATTQKKKALIHVSCHMKSPGNVLFLAFLEYICGYYARFSKRFQERVYNYDDIEIDLNYFEQHYALSFPSKHVYIFDEPFFDLAKKYYLDHDFLHGGKKVGRNWEVIRGQLLDDNKIKQFISTITYAQVHKVFRNLYRLP